MKRILMTIGSSIEGGAQRVFLDLARSLSRRGFVVGTALPAGPLADAVSEMGLPFCERVPLEKVRGLRGMRKVIARFRPDVIQAHLAKGSFLTAAANLITRIPLCAYLHNAPIHEALGPVQRRLYPAAYRALPRLCDGVIVPTESGREDLVRLGLPGSLIRVISPGVDATRFGAIKRKPTTNGAFRIGSVGRLSPEKGHEHLVRALALIKDLDWACQIVGDGPRMPDLKELVNELGLNGKVEFTGFRANPIESLEGLDLFVQPSINDAFPLAVIEAFLAERPVIATEVGGLRTLIQNGTTGVLVPPGQPMALAGAIRHAASHPDEMAAMATRAKERAAREFTLEGMTDAMVNYMRSLTEARAGSRRERTA